jgi:hypothetical protein
MSNQNKKKSSLIFCNFVLHFFSGGWHASTENTNKVERYDVAKNAWDFVCPMHERRYRPGVSVIGGKIYVMGGEEGWDRYVRRSKMVL